MPSRWLWRRSGRRTERISSTAPKKRHVFDDIFHIFVIFLIHFVLSIEVFCSHEDKMPHELPSEWVELSLYMFFLRNSFKAPNPWASASLFGTTLGRGSFCLYFSLFLGSRLSLHAFFFLLCRWKVGFRAAVHFQSARQVRDGYYVQATFQGIRIT